MATAQPAPFQEARLPITAERSLYYRDHGAELGGIPLLCLHGYWRTSRDFEELAAHFAGTRRVITVDLRGRGRSDWFPDPQDYRFEAIVDDVVLLLDTLGIDRVAIVGLALGAQIGMELAAKRSERVAALITNDTGPEANLGAGRSMKAFSGGDAIDHDEAMRRVRGQYEEDNPSFGDWEFDRILYRNYRRGDDGLYVRDFDQNTNDELRRMLAERPTFWDEFRAIGDIPFTVLRGENSHFLTLDIVERMKAARPDIDIVTIPGCGHPVMLWEPDAFAAIDATLGRIARTSAGACRPCLAQRGD